MLSAKYEWRLKNKTENKEQEKLRKKFNVPDAVIQLACERTDGTAEAIESFLMPQHTFYDPFLFYDMEKATHRIQQVVENNEKILVYGDYDADGITATTILVETLEMIGANVVYYLPNRFDDGYGPNESVYRYYIKQEVQLIITCDNGVQGHDAIAVAQGLGVDVIVTDHHEMGETLPEAYAIIHPRHPKGHYPFDDLCGAGVALKVASALLGEVPSEFLDMAAIGTVADLVSLTDENRSIVQMGLNVLKQTERVGLQELYHKLNLNSATITEETIGFTIAPHLNALGRMGDANPAVELMTTFDPDRALELVALLTSANTERKKTVETITEDVKERLKCMTEVPNIIILADSNWHEGVLGIVASRVVEHYRRPTILLHHNLEAQNYKGSGRSVEGVDLFKVLQSAAVFADKCGGHEMAAGMTISEASFDEWKNAVIEEMSHYQDRLECKDTLVVDVVLSLSDINIEAIEAFNRLRPFGTDNPKPHFLIEKVSLESVDQIGKDKNTLKLVVSNDSNTLDLIGFRMGEYGSKLQAGQTINVVMELGINEWKDKRKPQGHILDISSDDDLVFDWRRVHKPERIFSVENAYYYFSNLKLYQAYHERIPDSSLAIQSKEIQNGTIMVNKQSLVIFDCPTNLNELKILVNMKKIDCIYLFAHAPKSTVTIGIPTRQEFTLVYRYLQNHPNIPLKGREESLAHYLKLPLEKMHLILDIFVEKGLSEWQGIQMITRQRQQSVDLKQSKVLQNWQRQHSAEQFLRYNEIEQIRNFFFPGGDQ